MADRLIVASTGATGQLYVVRALELLADLDYEVHLVYSDAATLTLADETDYEPGDLDELADEVHAVRNVGAPIASGSFRTQGMLVAPCSMKTLANIANGNAGNLITRAADVTLKERRELVLMPREKPLNRIHLENMLAVTDAGAIVNPPFPSFYQGSDGIDEMITRTVARALSLFDVEVPYDEWQGLRRVQ